MKGFSLFLFALLAVLFTVTSAQDVQDRSLRFRSDDEPIQQQHLGPIHYDRVHDGPGALVSGRRPARRQNWFGNWGGRAKFDAVSFRRHIYNVNKKWKGQ